MENELIDQQIPQGDVNAMPYAVRFGIVGGLVCIVISVILYITDLQFESWARWLTTLAMIVVIFTGLRTISKEHPGREIEFGKLFGAGMVITVIIAVLSVIYFLIYVYVIDPEFINTTMEISRQKMVERGLSEDQIDAALRMSAKFMTPTVMSLISSVMTILIGAVFSAIAAAIYKKDR